MSIKREHDHDPVQEAAARLAERAQVFHLLALHHLELGRISASAGYQQAHYQSVVGIKLSEESRRLDLALLKLVEKHPNLQVEPTNNYSEILDILHKEEQYHAQMDAGSTGTASKIDSLMEALGEVNGRENLLRQACEQAQFPEARFKVGT